MLLPWVFRDTWCFWWLDIDTNFDMFAVVGVDLFNGRGYRCDGGREVILTGGTRSPGQVPVARIYTCARIAALKRTGQHGILNPCTWVPIQNDCRRSTL